MGHLDELFPNLIKILDDGFVPTWNNWEAPWELLKSGKGGLIDQISEKIGDQDVFIHPSAKIGKYVTIEGPSYVGPNAVIRHGAFLRKGSWICENALVGGSTEIKNSVLLPKSKAPHFNYVGDSILGIGVNLGAGTKLSNVRNDRKSIPITKANGERFDSKMRKLGALIGDESQLGCNVVTNPGTIIMPNTMIRPSETVTGRRI